MIIHAPANIQFTLANSFVAQLAPLGNTEDFHGSNPNFRIIKQNKNYSSLSCCSLHLRLDENCAAMPLWLLFGLSVLEQVGLLKNWVVMNSLDLAQQKTCLYLLC